MTADANGWQDQPEDEREALDHWEASQVGNEFPLLPIKRERRPIERLWKEAA